MTKELRRSLSQKGAPGRKKGNTHARGGERKGKKTPEETAFSQVGNVSTGGEASKGRGENGPLKGGVPKVTSLKKKREGGKRNEQRWVKGGQLRRGTGGGGKAFWGGKTRKNNAKAAPKKKSSPKMPVKLSRSKTRGLGGGTALGFRHGKKEVHHSKGGKKDRPAPKKKKTWR